MNTIEHKRRGRMRFSMRTFSIAILVGVAFLLWRGARPQRVAHKLLDYIEQDRLDHAQAMMFANSEQLNSIGFVAGKKASFEFVLQDMLSSMEIRPLQLNPPKMERQTFWEWWAGVRTFSITSSSSTRFQFLGRFRVEGNKIRDLTPSVEIREIQQKSPGYEPDSPVYQLQCIEQAEALRQFRTEFQPSGRLIVNAVGTNELLISTNDWISVFEFLKKIDRTP